MRSIYELWMEQSRDFITTADQNLRGIFTNSKTANPENHIAQIQAWMEVMKQQWEFAQAAHEQQEYWQMMTTICNDAADLMLQEWVRLSREGKPVLSIQELYQIWLNCCNEVYQKSLQTPSFHNAYGEFMKTAFRFWKNAVPTN